MDSSTIRFDRLKELAGHLETGQLAHERFDFSCYNANEDGSDLEIGACGTLGCAIGEFPAIWPEEFSWHGGGIASAKMKIWNGLDLAVCWLGIYLDAVEHLFFPLEQEPSLYGGRRLGPDATRHEVAANIRAFIEKFEPR